MKKILKLSIKFIFNTYFRNRVLGLIKNYTYIDKRELNNNFQFDLKKSSFFIIGACEFNHIVNILKKLGAKVYLTHDNNRPWDPFAEVTLKGSLLWKNTVDYIILSHV